MPETTRIKKLKTVESKILSYEDLEFKPARILKTVEESPKVKSFYLEYGNAEPPKPGQFLMVWLPRCEEIPMSISDAGQGFIRISVAKAGPTTTEIHNLKRGDLIFLRGPFGNSFSTAGNSFMIVGGGYGVAPLIYAAKIISRGKKRCVYLTGAVTKTELLFIKEARKLGIETNVATEDGSAGQRGVVTDLLSSRKNFESILTCGPEQMMYEVVRYGLKNRIRVQASLERYMKCGFGICGSCVLDPIGLRVCKDGPVFDGAMLLETEFGRQKRDESGSRVEV